MPVVPITQTSASLDLQSRAPVTTAIVGSPSAATETTIASLTIQGDLAVQRSVVLRAFAAFTVGTSGTAVRLRVRKDTISGTTIGDTGALTGGVTAAALVVENLVAVDTSPSNTGQVYVLTLTVTGGAAASTVSAVEMDALIV